MAANDGPGPLASVALIQQINASRSCYDNKCYLLLEEILDPVLTFDVWYDRYYP